MHVNEGVPKIALSHSVDSTAFGFLLFISFEKHQNSARNFGYNSFRIKEISQFWAELRNSECAAEKRPLFLGQPNNRQFGKNILIMREEGLTALLVFHEVKKNKVVVVDQSRHVGCATHSTASNKERILGGRGHS
ncbi:hypothetical protein Y032_0057g2737 [Ancylostoma ceylanicum]|uniref:Uncharacterized protein n=1 Tax=Ancylostoma ceylanicum TaxID=53326 RepID=A0A016U4J8_9BILA|nr:hypothetical protein Y032_0057g2737 [Ancylostoma ceylanicum]